MKVAFPFGEGGPLAVDEVLVIKDFYCQLLGETRYYNVYRIACFAINIMLSVIVCFYGLSGSPVYKS